MNWDGVARYKHPAITCLLLAMLAGGGHLGSRAEGVVFYLVVFGVALLANPRGRWFNLLLAGSTALFGLAWLNAFRDVGFNLLFCAAGLICLEHGTTATVFYILRSKRVNVGEVFALMNCYLLMGYAWALLYSLVQTLAPGSFSLPGGGERLVDAFIYFSFVTMTTVGYGDTLPHTVLAQRLCVTQAVLGQFYFALVVAWLLNRLFQQRMEDAGRQPRDPGEV